MSQSNKKFGRCLPRLQRIGALTLLAGLVMTVAGADQQGESESVAEALRDARQQLQKAQQAQDEAAEAREQARQALQQTLKAYEKSAQQQDATIEQITALTRALSEYTKAVDQLAKQRDQESRQAARRAASDGQAAVGDKKAQQSTAEAPGDAGSSDQPAQQAEDKQPGSEADAQLAKQQGREGQPAQAEAPADADQPEQPESESDSAESQGGDTQATAQVVKAPAEIADGPIAPESQAPSALWNDTTSEKDVAAKIIGAEGAQNSCAKCHTLETKAWKQSHHFTSFENTHRSDRARQILRNMDKRSMKFRNDTCRKCHYTSTVQRDRIRPISGVSCESCHGPGEDWVKIHNRVGGSPDAKVFEWGEGSETPKQRKARLEKARKQGMNHSGMLYAIASNCVKCHTVPNEKLVNQGDHKAGSDFNLVSWSQGEVRHNFLSSSGAPDNPTNAAAKQARKRMMYVVGTVANLEYSLRNLTHVDKQGGKFHKAMIERVNMLRGKLAQINSAADMPAIDFALKQVPKGVTADTDIPDGLPELIAKTGRRFEARHDGTKLAALDNLLPEKTKGEPFQGP